MVHSNQSANDRSEENRRPAGRTEASALTGLEQGPNNFSLLIRLLKRHLLLILLPLTLFSALGAVYVVTRKPSWKATQTLQIRDELALRTELPGRFQSLDMMKMVQETIHETVRRHGVVSKVLDQVAPPSDYKKTEQWPSVEDIESMQDSITLAPPNGAPFGGTEILLLSVKDQSVERAKQLVRLLAEELQLELNQLRDKRAKSIENELVESVRLATEELESSNQQLTGFEKDLGEILVDLRSINNDTGSNGTVLQSRLNALLIEIRSKQQTHDVLKKQLDNIQYASEDPRQVLSFSVDLLAAQPTLRSLKEELIRLQSNTAKTLGQFEPHHAKAKAAIEAEQIVKNKIQDEVQIAASGLKSQLAVVQEQIDRFLKKRKELEGKINRLAELRAPYSTLVKVVDKKREILNQELEELARARAMRAAIKTSNLISLLEDPYSGSRPEGMSKKMIIGLAGAAGLMSGLGLVLFAASPSFIGFRDLENGDSTTGRINPRPNQLRRHTPEANLAPGHSVDRSGLPEHIQTFDFETSQAIEGGNRTDETYISNVDDKGELEGLSESNPSSVNESLELSQPPAQAEFTQDHQKETAGSSRYQEPEIEEILDQLGLADGENVDDLSQEERQRILIKKMFGDRD